MIGELLQSPREWPVRLLFLVLLAGPLPAVGQSLQSVTAQVIAEACIGRVRLDILRPKDNDLYWRATLRLRSGVVSPTEKEMYWFAPFRRLFGHD